MKELFSWYLRFNFILVFNYFSLRGKLIKVTFNHIIKVFENYIYNDKDLWLDRIWRFFTTLRNETPISHSHVHVMATFRTRTLARDIICAMVALRPLTTAARVLFGTPIWTCVDGLVRSNAVMAIGLGRRSLISMEVEYHTKILEGL
jgi:hypothetical protein